MRHSNGLSLAVVAVSLSLVSVGLAIAEDRPTTASEGKLAPELTVTGWKNTKELKLADLKGKVVVLKFWATWCGPCKSTLGTLQKLSSNTYKDKNVVFIAVHAQKECASMPAFVDRNKFTYACCQDDKGDTAKAYGAKELPFNVLIDKKGNIKKLDAEINEKEIDKLLEEK